MKTADSSLKGLVVPVPTPFDDSDHIDAGALLAHVDWLAEQGVDHLFVNGTTAEFFSLTLDEQLQILQLVRGAWKGAVIFHLGSTALFQCLETAHKAEHAGADFIASLPPYYFVDAPGIVEWFSRLSLEIDLPFILYNFPKHTGNALTTEMVQEIPHWGMKDSSGDLSLAAATPNYFVGGDRKISAAYEAGAKGFVSAAANIDPSPYLRIQKFHELPARRSLGKGGENQEAVNQVNARATGPFAIAKIKQALSEILPGYPSSVRPPLTPAPVA
jgi:4-hydroxy-tetrahydrodipicolinate synthase